MNNEKKRIGCVNKVWVRIKLTERGIFSPKLNLIHFAYFHAATHTDEIVPLPLTIVVSVNQRRIYKMRFARSLIFLY